MTVKEDIEERIASAKRSLHTLDPIVFLDEIRGLLRKACGKGGDYDSAGPLWEDGQGIYFAVVEFLLGHGFVSAAQELLVEWWDDVGARQLTENRHIGRGNSAYKLMQLHERKGDEGAAIRWALLAHADDLLGTNPNGGGAAKQWLRTKFGMSKQELAEFRQIATQDSGTMRLAEGMIIRLALSDFSLEHLFSRPSSCREFPASLPYLKALWNRVLVSRNSTKNTEKGSSLETLAKYLFLLVPGWVPRRNVLDLDKSFEADIVVSNLSPANSLTAELFGRHILVECKNWKDPVGVQEIGYFLFRMRLTHCSFGVIIAPGGITGKSGKDKKVKEIAARSLIRKVFHEDGITCVVLEKNELVALVNGEIRFLSLLLSETEQFRFGLPKQINDS